MEKKTKIFILVFGGVLVLGSITAGVVLHFQKKKREQEELETAEQAAKKLDEKRNVSSSNGPNSSTGQSVVSDGLIHPVFNTEGELMTPAHKIKGRYLYPKRKEQGGWGYSNIRTSAEVNTDQGWWDPSDNLITTLNSGVRIGKVLSETAGVYNNYSYRWFKVRLSKKVETWWEDYTTGYVRADTVTHKPF